jgi:transcriptional regulator GlxA family with amidase domain
MGGVMPLHKNQLKIILNMIIERNGLLTQKEAGDLIGGKSDRYVRRLFTTFHEKSFRQACIDAKLTYGRCLIVTANLSIDEIAERLNYLNRNHFDESYQNKFGLSPAIELKRIKESRLKTLSSNPPAAGKCANAGGR